MKNKFKIFLIIILTFIIINCNKHKVKSKNEFVIFTYTPQNEVSKIFIAGDFNNWQPNDIKFRLKKSKGKFKIKINKNKFKKGKNRYIFIIDGEWVPDPNARMFEKRGIAGKVSVIIIN